MVRVVWRDAHFEFESDGSEPADYLVSTLGYVILDGPQFLSVAAEKLPDGSYRAVTHIPRAVIEQITQLHA